MEIITLICSLIIGGFFLVANLTGAWSNNNFNEQRIN